MRMYCESLAFAGILVVTSRTFSMKHRKIELSFSVQQTTLLAFCFLEEEYSKAGMFQTSPSVCSFRSSALPIIRSSDRLVLSAGNWLWICPDNLVPVRGKAYLLSLYERDMRSVLLQLLAKMHPLNSGKLLSQ